MGHTQPSPGRLPACFLDQKQQKLDQLFKWNSHCGFIYNRFGFWNVHIVAGLI